MIKTAFFCHITNTTVAVSGEGLNSNYRSEPLRILRNTVRSEYITKVRYKYIVKPEYVYEATIHEPLLLPRILLKQNTTPVWYVNFTDAVLHHYRQIGKSL